MPNPPTASAVGILLGGVAKPKIFLAGVLMLALSSSSATTDEVEGRKEEAVPCREAMAWGSSRAKERRGRREMRPVAEGTQQPGLLGQQYAKSDQEQQQGNGGSS